MPNRVIKESINESKGLSKVSFFAEDLYKRLITYADDYGRFNADFQIILARLYPREIGIVSESDIEDALIELTGVGKVALYTSKAREEVYGCFPNWSEHQRIRDSKLKAPEPDDTTVNDWYLRRFIPIELKRKIIERDKFKCQECGKFICASCSSADRLIKMGAGLFHIDHIVPVIQGGRATEENLRLLCPTCNLKRARSFTFTEILEFSKSAESCGELQQSAESCGVLRLESNPIQSNPKKNPNPNPTRARFSDFWSAYPKKVAKPDAERAWNKLNANDDLVERIIEDVDRRKTGTEWIKDNGRYIPYPATYLNQHRWEDEEPNHEVGSLERKILQEWGEEA